MLLSGCQPAGEAATHSVGPWVTWVVLLLRILLEDTTGEIRGRTASG
jgi:hypothetical protein